MRCATLVALNEMGADVQSEDVAQDLRQIQRLILEGSRQFHTARKARDWAAVHGGENLTERASEVCSNLLGAINSAPPGHPPYVLDAMERLLYLTNEANLLHQQAWGTHGEEERDLATAEEYRPLRKRARHQADVISHGGGPDTQPETLPEPRQELMAMRKLRRLMPFLTGDTQNLASEALQDLCQWSMQFWGDVVFLVESDQEEENQRRATSGEQPTNRAHSSAQPGLPGDAPGPLPQPPVGALPHDPARPLLPDAATEQEEPREAPLRERPPGDTQGYQRPQGRLPRQAEQALQEPGRHSPPAEGTGPLPRPADGALQHLPELPPPPGDARGRPPQPAEERGEPAELPGPEDRGQREVPETTTSNETTTDNPALPAQGLPPLPGAARRDQDRGQLPQETTEEERSGGETTERPGHFGPPPRQRPLPQHGALLHDQGLPQLPTTTTQQETTEEERPASETTGRPGRPPQELRPRRPHPGVPATAHTATTEAHDQDGGQTDCQATAVEPDSTEAETVPWHPPTVQWRTALGEPPAGEADLSESESGQSHRRRRAHAAFDA